jgi:hypothetical protein
MARPFRLSLFAKTLPLVALAVAAKLAARALGWEVVSLNALFSGVITANVFLLGFLLAGVLADYKESERLPGELASRVSALADECQAMALRGHPDAARLGYGHLRALAATLREWFHKSARTEALMDELDRLTKLFAAYEPLTTANFVVRMKQEQSAVRQLATRVRTIRETSFVQSGYRLAETTSLLLVAGLAFAKVGGLIESAFFATAIPLLFVYMLALIKDLDNPFKYYDGGDHENVSLQPLVDLEDRLRRLSEQGAA